MGIELPPELADVAAQAGVEWPEADEDAMAKQAQAWRDTATSMSTLATDADTTARSALQTVSGETATKASTEWKTFVDPDNGHLTSVVRDANAAADRLEHAADQVGTAKVEIVRNLVGLAQNQDAAHAAAQAGHPTALAGLDTAVHGTAANVAHIQTQLVNAVQPTSGVDMAAVQNPVNANPGHHLLAGLTTDATQTPPGTGQPATTHSAPLIPGTGATNLLSQTTGALANTTSGGADLVHHVTGAADQAVSGATDLTQHATGDASDLVRHTGDTVGGTADQIAPGAGDIPRHGASGAADLVQHGGNTIGQLPGDVANTGPGTMLPAPGHPGDLPPGGHPNLPGPGLPGDPEVTGPVPHTNFPGDVPTPPTGQTVQAGFAGGLEPAAAPAPTNLPPAATVAPPLNPAAPALGGTPGFAGTPAVPVPPVIGGAPAPAPAPGVTATPGAPAAQPARPAAYAPVPAAGADRPQEPAPRKQMAGPPGAPPPAKGERNEVLAAFWIHMFPIGHLPVASYRPARQLPPPPPELDYAAGLRFEPADHPQFHLIDANPRLAKIKIAIAQEQAAKAAAEAKLEYQHYAPTPAPGYPPAPPAHPAEAVAAGYPPPGPPPAEAPPTYAPAEAGAAGYPVVVPPAAGYPPAAAPSAPGVAEHSAASHPLVVPPAAGYPPAAAPPAPGVAEHSAAIHPPAASYPSAAAPPTPSPAGHPAASHPSTAGYPPAAPAASQPTPPGADAATVPSMRPVTPSAGLTADHPTVHNLLADHDPLGGSHERDWDRRYLVRLGSVTAHGISPEGLEYNWPTSEQYPEGGSASGEPEVLDEGTVIDRFGTPHGRVFAADGTPFAQRSLPPPHKDTGFRRYKVVKPLPVWRAVSAAWFGQPGGGVRYRTTHSAVELVALGYLEEIA